MSYLKQIDPEIYDALMLETRREADKIELIASENFVSEAVLEAVASLPEKYQLPVTLRYLQELSYEEIGDFMDLPKSTIRGILYMANKLLREELRDIWTRGEAEWRHVSE